MTIYVEDGLVRSWITKYNTCCGTREWELFSVGTEWTPLEQTSSFVAITQRSMCMGVIILINRMISSSYAQLSQVRCIIWTLLIFNHYLSSNGHGMSEVNLSIHTSAVEPAKWDNYEENYYEYIKGKESTSCEMWGKWSPTIAGITEDEHQERHFIKIWFHKK